MIALVLFLIVILLYFFLIFPRVGKRRDVLSITPHMFAHRGYHNIERRIPENSMAAFRAAIRKGYGIELDLHLSRDGQLIVFHDYDLRRLCGSPGVVEHMTYDELSRYSLLDTDEKIPLFQDVLSVVNGQVPLLVELKIPTSSLEICQKTYALLENYPGSYMVQSFNSMGLRWFRKHAPSVLRGQLSSHLTTEKTGEPWFLRFIVQNLFCNFIGRPDFISYRQSDLPHPVVLLLKYLFHTPIAVWTLKTWEDLKKGTSRYHIQIFEKHGENY